MYEENEIERIRKDIYKDMWKKSKEKQNFLKVGLGEERWKLRMRGKSKVF